MQFKHASQRYQSLQLQPKLTQEITARYVLTPTHKRRLKSAHLLRHRRSVMVAESQAEIKAQTTTFYSKVNAFVTKINSQVNAIPDGIINYPQGQQFYSHNRFRPAVSKKSQRLKKVRKVCAKGPQDYNRFIKTVTEEFNKTVRSSSGLTQSTAFCAVSRRTKTNQSNFNWVGQKRNKTFESVSSLRSKELRNDNLQLNVEGKRYL